MFPSSTLGTLDACELFRALGQPFKGAEAVNTRLWAGSNMPGEGRREGRRIGWWNGKGGLMLS